MRKIIQTLLLTMLITGTLSSCQNCKAPKNLGETTTKVKHLEWSRNANIYEVNIRQYTKEGTLNAFAQHLPRLQEMGVDILWLMPIHPISEKNRKGSMGSYYAVKDYRAVNPEFGTMDDFKNLVNKAHELGMHIILDWVPNHTGWDNVLITEHPEWYTKNEKGDIIIPEGTDWTDVADLNYDNQELRKYMIESLKFWIENADIDGYRCDVAGSVPTDFWETAIKELNAVKPVFMLAEAWEPELLSNAFDMCYGWEFHHLMNEIAKGKKTAKDIDTYFVKIDAMYPKDGYIMNFITNHDENSWNGTVYERMGEGANTFAVLTFTMPGMPLIYSGQEAALSHRLKFFEKDEIDWGNRELEPFYTKLLKLKTDNKALRNGEEGGALERIPSGNDKFVYAFSREKDDDKVVVILNLSGKEQEAVLQTGKLTGEYTCLFSSQQVNLEKEITMALKPWEYRVLVK